ncbi:MAG: PQQ-binding-like beta-propeller repeat protein [bacterium]
MGITDRYRTLRQCARGVGGVALVFSLTVATLLAVDGYRSSLAETVRSEVLAQALAQGRSTPQDAQAVAFAREMDQLARRVYFNSLTFRQSGIALLVVGLLVAAGCFGVAWRLSLKIPDPRTLGGEDPVRSDRLAVNAVLVAGIALLAGATALHVAYGRRAARPADRALRASLKNPALKPGEAHVCPCCKGTQQAALEGQWPFLRGPAMSGRIAETNAPVAWNGETGQNIRWKVALKRGGASTPAVWGKRIFLTSGDAAARTVMAHDAETGALLWSKDVPDGAKSGEPLPEVGEDAGFAASSPACDEARVYAVFGTGDLAALDYEGNIVWQVFLGRPKNTYGHASSLVYRGEMLLVQWDQEEHARIIAVDKTTGKTLWETPREVGMSWSTPVIMPLCDKHVLLMHASKVTWGMELATGKKLWEVEAVTGEVAPSLAWEGDVWLAANMYSKMAAFKLPPEGAPQKLWEWEDGNLPDVASPVIADGLVYLATDAGEVLCHDLANGKQVWKKEFADGFYASPVVAGGKLYVVDRVKGVFHVYAAGRDGREVSSNPLGEGVRATPAFAGGRIYVRGAKNLWCVEAVR